MNVLVIHPLLALCMWEGKRNNICS